MKNNSADLRSFLLTLQSDNELVSVKRDVNTEYEIAAVSARLDGKQAVLFEKVRGSKIRVACNTIATPRRFYLALGGSSHKSHEEDVKKNIHPRVNEALHALSEPTRTESGGLFEENSSTSLYDLPIVTLLKRTPDHSLHPR